MKIIYKLGRHLNAFIKYICQYIDCCRIYKDPMWETFDIECY